MGHGALFLVEDAVGADDRRVGVDQEGDDDVFVVAVGAEAFGLVGADGPDDGVQGFEGF